MNKARRTSPDLAGPRRAGPAVSREVEKRTMKTLQSRRILGGELPTPGFPGGELRGAASPGRWLLRARARVPRLRGSGLLALSVALCVWPCLGQEWTRFRGPNGTGISHATTIPSHLTDADLNWKVELPGMGHSSPVLWGERIFLTSSGDKSGGIFVLCLDVKDGRLLWHHDFSLEPFPRHPFNSYASSTPAVDAQRVYVVWNEPDDPQFVKGSARSGKSFIVAVDASTGKTLWQTPRRSAVVAYATPCVYEPKRGKPALIFGSQGHGIYGVNPETGKILWDYEQAFDKRCVSSPVIAGDIILGSCGSGGGGNVVAAVRPGDATIGRKSELVYQLKKSAPYVPTGVAMGAQVWLWSDSGIVTCLDAASGAIRYQERAGGDYFGSPVWVEGRLFCVSTAGELVVLEESDRFNVLHRYPLHELCHSTPAVALGRLFIRTEKHLWSLGGAKTSAAR